MVWLLPDAHVNICGDVYVTPSTVNERPLEFVWTVTVIGFEGALPALPIMKLSILTGAGKTHPLSQQYHCEGLYVLSVAVIESLTPFFPYTSAFIVLFASTFTRSVSPAAISRLSVTRVVAVVPFVTRMRLI